MAAGGTKNGIIWPVVLLFLLSLCGFFVGIVCPKLLSEPPDRILAVWFFAAALVSGILLYVPNWVIARKIPNLAAITDDVSTIRANFLGQAGARRQISDIRTVLSGAAGTDDKIVALSNSIRALNDKITALNSRFEAAPAIGDVRRDILAIAPLVNSINTMVAPAGAARNEFQEIKAALAKIATDIAAIKAKQ